MSEPTDRAPTPTERLLAALDPQTDHDVGLAVVIAQDLPGDTAATLAELIERRIGRVLANLVLAEHMAETATTPGVPDPAQLAELTQAHRRLARSLQPQGDDRGMLVALATWLGADRASRLAGMVSRAIAGAYERGHAEG
jgi:hypothetical protein